MTYFVPVIYVKKRVVDKSANANATLNFHTHRVYGGLLNVEKQYYTRRVVGQDKRTVMGTLQEIKNG